MDLEDDEYCSEIWRWDGEILAKFTSGPQDRAPRWSPDGAQIAFLRRTSPGVYQVAVMPTDGGEAQVVTDFELGAIELEWSPDGRHLAAVAMEWADGYSDIDEDERSRRPRRITKLPYRFDNRGWTHDKRRHVWVIDPRGETAARCVTPGEHEEFSVSWHPDGTQLAFVSARTEPVGLVPSTEIYTVAVDGGEVTQRTAGGSWQYPTFDKDGRLYAAGDPDVWSHPGISRLWDLAGDEPVAVTADLDRNVVVPSPPSQPPQVQWLDDGSGRVLIEDRGSVVAYSVGRNTPSTELIGGRMVMTGASWSADGSTAVYVASTTTNPGEVFLWSEDGGSQAISDLNSGLAATLVEPTQFTIEHDGVAIEGWIYLPPGDGPVPLLLNIHGGPATQYSWGFFDEFQVYVGAGYGVVATNPRGSSGYGLDHVRSIFGTWQEELPPDMRDLSAAVDAAAATEPRLDTDRVGIMGGSYGGLATVRLIAMDQRYKAAVAERGLYVFNSFTGTSDIAPWFTQMYLGRDAIEDPAVMWDASSLKGFGSITTPTLVLHSEHDFRCPIEQAEQLFVALLRNGTPTELLRFPGPASHELSRSGKPKHRVERFEAILDWHGRYLSD